MWSWLRYLSLILLLIFHNALSFNILAIVSVPLGSHYMAFRTLFHELAVRGHNVTVINNFPDKDPPPNLKFVDLQRGTNGSAPSLEFYETLDPRYLHWYNIYRHIVVTAGNNEVDCETLLTNVNALAHLAEGRAYDVIFVEQFMNDCGLAYALTFYDAPIIGISSHVLLPSAYPRFGLPFDPAADAFYFSNSGPNPSLYHKVETTLVNWFFTTIGRWYFQRSVYDAFDIKVPGKKLDIEKDARSRMKMMFSNQHFSVTGARPLAPQLLEIAGIHVGVPKLLPEILNNGDIPTFDTIRGNRFSSFVDVTACSADLLSHVEDWKVDEQLINSDHNAITFRMRLKKAKEYSLDVESVARDKMKMMFTYISAFLYNRCTGFIATSVGNVRTLFCVRTPKPVTPEIGKFLASAEHGAIYVSFGSNLKANTMSKQKLQQFLTAFKQLPYKVIWKYENAPFNDEDILTGDWFPQLDILCHPKILAFVSHGGMLSISETTHCAKPILTVPFFGDQFSNSAAVRAVGLGKTLFFNTLNAENLEATIRELTSPEIQENVQRISRLWHDRPQPIMDSAIYWIEYVVRHKSAPPSLPAKFNNWFESLLIDVAIVILGIIILLVLLSYIIFRFVMFSVLKIFGLCLKPKEKKIKIT